MFTVKETLEDRILRDLDALLPVDPDVEITLRKIRDLSVEWGKYNADVTVSWIHDSLYVEGREGECHKYIKHSMEYSNTMYKRLFGKEIVNL